jgi:hypothetical protein
MTCFLDKQLVIPFAKAGIVKLGLKYLKIGTKPSLMLKTLRFFLLFTLTTGKIHKKQKFPKFTFFFSF